MLNFTETIQLISIWGITLPLIIGIVNYKTSGFQYRVFIFFLLVGFCTDITMYMLKGTDRSSYLRDILNCYSLTEAMVFFWLIYHNATLKLIAKISKGLLIITPIVWILGMIIRAGYMNTSPGRVFDPFYEVSVAFLIGFLLLKMVEEMTLISQLPIFWILLGIFFYCFCTFFMMGFLNTVLSQQIWFLNNIINIITYIFYSVGLMQIRNSTGKMAA